MAAAEEQWPEPHDRRFDFAGTAIGAEWIDELAAQARTRLAARSDDIVVADSDWRAEHVRFEDDEIVEADDWQSLAVGRKPALLGAAARAFTADWDIPQARRIPALEESRAFVADYEAARGARFSEAERATIDAAWMRHGLWRSLRALRRTARPPCRDRRGSIFDAHALRTVGAGDGPARVVAVLRSVGAPPVGEMLLEGFGESPRARLASLAARSVDRAGPRRPAPT